jgi:hypothetical protein
MNAIAKYPAVKQINFYIREASPELLVERREYLEHNVRAISRL